MRQRKFDASVILCVVRRCSFGCPQAAVTYPIMHGAPFPTIFWLTCPHLEKICSALESDHKIPEFEQILASKPEETENMHGKYAELRMALMRCMLRIKKDDLCGLNGKVIRVLEESGVGGIDYKAAPYGAKCLHLQTATWLGMGSHPAAEWLAEHIGPLECSECLCKKNKPIT